MGLKVQFLFLALITYSAIMAVNSARFPSRKTWWSKKITDDLHVAGQLTRSQFLFAREAGFKSIIQVLTIDSREIMGNDTTDPLLLTSEEFQIANDLGFYFNVLRGPGDKRWNSLEAVQIFTSYFNVAEKPVLLHCSTSYASSFIGLMHYFNQSKQDPNAQPSMDVHEFFKRASGIGHNYAADSVVKTLVLSVDGSVNETPKYKLPEPNINIASWGRLQQTWKLKPLSRNIFLAGQISIHEIQIFKDLGLKVIVNHRKGVTVSGKPSQEEAILLNIKDRTGTYDNNGVATRQTKDNLEANRVNASLPTTYVSSTAQYNYQSRNKLQFADSVGYNETLQRMAVKEAGVGYHHMPIGGVYKYGLPMWEAYRDSLMKLGRNNDAILLHCRTGYRAAVTGLLMQGCLYGVGFNETLRMAHAIGYEFIEDQETELVNLLRIVLDNPEEHCESKLVPTRPDPTEAGASSITLASPLGIVLFVFCGLRYLSISEL